MRIADLPILQTIDLELILAIRERRRLVARPVKVTKVKPNKVAKDPLAGMTKEQLEKLLEELTQ